MIFTKLWLILITSFALCVMGFVFYKNSYDKLEIAYKELLELKIHRGSFLEKEKEEELFRQRYAKADPHFLQSHLEGLSLLEKEQEVLGELFARSSFIGYEPMEQRWNFLLENRIVLEKISETTTSQYKEVHYKFRSPVEADNRDVENILHIVEGEIPSAPQLIVKQCSLERKENGHYLVDMEIIERNSHE